MSSGVFAIELEPSGLLRAMLLGCGAIAAAIGLALLYRLPLAGMTRVLLVLLWLALSVHELMSRLRGARWVRAIRLDAGGTVCLKNSDGDWQPAVLRSGSLVLTRWAWLLLELPGGGHYGELLYAGGQKSADWHGLLLIWRQRRGVFGGHRGS